MTEQQHPITPPPELVQQWTAKYWGNPREPLRKYERDLATQFARWGADQELEACINAIARHPGFESPELFIEVLRAARRPKPPSLAEQALEQLNGIETVFKATHGGDLVDDNIRRALERLQELERND